MVLPLYSLQFFSFLFHQKKVKIEILNYNFQMYIHDAIQSRTSYISSMLLVFILEFQKKLNFLLWTKVRKTVTFQRLNAKHSHVKSFCEDSTFEVRTFPISSSIDKNFTACMWKQIFPTVMQEPLDQSMLLTRSK